MPVRVGAITINGRQGDGNNLFESGNLLQRMAYQPKEKEIRAGANKLSAFLVCYSTEGENAETRYTFDPYPVPPH
jgi:hypothetical protein